jgi:hypothetical protein
VAAGLLAFIFSFVSYYSYSLGPLSKDFSAWDGFFGWFSMLLALLASLLLAVHLFAPQVQLGIPVRLVVLGGSRSPRCSSSSRDSSIPATSRGQASIAAGGPGTTSA